MGEMGRRSKPEMYRGAAHLGVDIFRGDSTMGLEDYAHMEMGKGGGRSTDGGL
jgi:hypothetical protein